MKKRLKTTSKNIIIRIYRGFHVVRNPMTVFLVGILAYFYCKHPVYKMRYEKKDFKLYLKAN